MKERETEVINIHVPQIERSSKYLLHGNTSQNKTTMLLELFCNTLTFIICGCDT